MQTSVTRVFRVELDSLGCRSAETLVAMNVRDIPGVDVVSVNRNGVLLAACSTERDLYEDVVRAVVSAGLAPGSISTAPLGVPPVGPPLSIEDAEKLGLLAPPKEPVRAELHTVQRVSVTVTDGYDPETIIVTAGIPAEITFSEGHGCLAHVVFEGLGIEADLRQGGATVSIPALEPGKYPFSCGMRMVHGMLIAE